MNIDHLPTPLYIAHRGLSARFPENTLAAFNAAVAAGAVMIELDVTLSRDRRLVILHDRSLPMIASSTGSSG